jgi:hypothetical protein
MQRTGFSRYGAVCIGEYYLTIELLLSSSPQAEKIKFLIPAIPVAAHWWMNNPHQWERLPRVGDRPEF